MRTDLRFYPLFYNNEQALRALIYRAYLAPVDDYVKVQRLPTGKIFADKVFLPRKGSDKPAMIIDLKYDKTAEGVIEQIRNSNYPENVAELSSELLMVGINYNSTTSKHECKIERWMKC